MLISLNWIRDFVDLPADIDPRALAERFTTTTAEVEGIEHVTCAAKGLTAEVVAAIEPIPESSLSLVQLGAAESNLRVVTAAQGLRTGDLVLYAPAGATVPGVGTVGEKTIHVAGSQVLSRGMLVSGEALGLTSIGQRPIWLPPSTRRGPIDSGAFDDWIIEVDNKSITHRPDLWGHYGIARELAAMYGLRLREYAVTPMQDLQKPELPEIPITIDDPAKSPRYSALRFAGVKPQPAPLWMQLRLAHVGLRPIDILVDLTNYIMAELGQPMHAFDAAGIDCIEVATAKPGEKFVTLDGVTRTMPEGALMIQSHRRSVALAGIMGGANTEIKPGTSELLLESANFEPATIRRCAAALGHRTDASARFEKSQDPANTVLAIQRFVHLARPELPTMRLTSRLSDAFPHPPQTTVIRVDPRFVARYIGREIPRERIEGVLKALEFKVRTTDDVFEVTVPSFRATKDITIEVDVIEEVARFVGYGSIEPVLPEVTVRYAEPDAAGRLERQSLALLCGGMSYAEVHRYIWFEDTWIETLGFRAGPTVTLRNPAAAGEAHLRTTLIPGMLAAVDLNRRSIDRFELLEIGSVFCPDATSNSASGPAARSESYLGESRRLALALTAPGRKPAQEDELLRRLKTDLQTWAFQLRCAEVSFAPADAMNPWEHEAKTAAIWIGGENIGRLTAVPATLKRRIDERLLAWSIALAELNLSAVVSLPPTTRKLPPVPVFPQIDLDFSVLADAGRRYADLQRELAGYDHPLLRRLAFVDSYEGGAVPAGQRSFTFRARLADPNRTLTEHDVQEFRANFIAFLNQHELVLRT